MLFPTAGSKLFIANAPADEAGPFPGSGWIEIGSTEAIGMLGIEWDLLTADVIGDCDAEGLPQEMAIKNVLRRPELPIIMGNDPSDPGQLLLWSASRSRLSYPFRLVFPDGVTARNWFALVIRIGEVFDTANSVMKLQVDIKPTSDISRNGGT